MVCSTINGPADYFFEGPHYVAAQLAQDLVGMQQKDGYTKLYFQERNRLRVEINAIPKE